MNLPTIHSRPRLRPVLVVLLPLLLVVGACGTSPSGDRGTMGGDADGGAFDGSPLATVTVQDWSGWQEDQPKPSTREMELAVGSEFTLDVITGPTSFTVTDVDQDSVALEADRDFSVEAADGSSSLNDLHDEFTISNGAPLVIGTPTLDAGTTVTFELT